MPLRRLWVSLLFGALAGCTGSRGDARPDTAAGGRPPSAESVAVSAAVPTPLPDVSAHPIQWTATRAADALGELGLAVTTAAAPVREPFLAPSGTRFVVHAGTDSAEVLAFIYGGAIAAGRDVERLDTAAVSPRTVRVTWRAPARLVTDNNLVAIVVSESDALRARVADAFHQRTQR